MKCAVSVLTLAACGRLGFEVNDARRDSAPGDATSDADPLSQGLLLQFAFDSDGLLVDRAKQHPATCSSCPTAVVGRIGDGAARFAATDCVTIADPGDLEPAQLTIAAWVAPSTAQFSTVIGKTFHGDTGMSNSIEMGEQNNTDTWNVYLVGASVGTPAQLGGWHHLAGVVDASTVTFYVDGAPVGSNAVSPPTYTTEPFRIGCDLDVNMLSSFFQGDLDDIRLYDRTLSAEQIAALIALP